MLNVFAEPSGARILAGVRAAQMARANAPESQRTQMRVSGGRNPRTITNARAVNLGPTMAARPTRVAGGRGRNAVQARVLNAGRGRNRGLVQI